MIVEDVYKVFGDNLPSTRSAYSAHTNKPHSMLSITKQYKTWKAFVLAYHKHAIAERNKSVVTVTKEVSKDDTSK